MDPGVVTTRQTISPPMFKAFFPEECWVLWPNDTNLLNDWKAGKDMTALPSNHTNGTVPGTSTRQAMVADNDLAVGQIVEALTRSPFWKKMAIFIVKDDAQDGVNHVDGHRTTAFVVSPYSRRGAVDSIFYSQLSILKTIELQLGLTNLTIFDRIANDMRASFQNTPDFAPYQAGTPKQSIFAMNPPTKTGKRESACDR